MSSNEDPGSPNDGRRSGDNGEQNGILDISQIIGAAFATSMAGPSGVRVASSSHSHVPIVAISAGPGVGPEDDLPHTAAMDFEGGLPMLSSGSNIFRSLPPSAMDSNDAAGQLHRVIQRAENEPANREINAKDSKNGKEKNAEDEARLAQIYESFEFEPIWDRLSQVLTRLEGDPNAAQVLLPLIEVSTTGLI